MYLESATRLFMTRASGSTTWLYPKADIQRALATTTFSFTKQGNNIVSPTINDIIGIFNDIYNQTEISQPIGNKGFSCNEGTLLEDLGETLYFILTSGEIVVKWRLVKQLTPQTNPPLSTPGNSPNGTIGYVTVFCSFGKTIPAGPPYIDPPSVIRVG